MSYVAKYTIDKPNTWEKKTIVIPFNFTEGDWNFANGVGLQIYFVMAIDAPHFTNTPGMWVKGNRLIFLTENAQKLGLSY